MAKLPAAATKGVIGVIVAAIVVVGGYYLFFNGSSTKSVTARFPQAVGVYVGTPVRMLGVQVGEVSSVKPEAQYVAVKMTYDSEYRIDAKSAYANEVANSLVSDRYIELGPLMANDSSTPALADNATITRTGAPAEIDQIYSALNQLSVALGPNGANKGGQQNGALSLLLKVSASNLSGNGTAIGQSITNLAAAAKTLADRKEGLFGTVRNLQKFTSALKSSDAQVRLFNQQLAEVAGDLAAERSDLGGALQQLGIALNEVKTFVQGNASKFHTDIAGLVNLTNLLVRQKASLKETLAIAPVALANIVHAYQPSLGAIATRGNLVSLTNLGTTPTQLVCSLVNTVTGTAGISLPGAASSTLNSVCASQSAASKAAGNTAVSTMLNGGVPPGQLIGSSR